MLELKTAISLVGMGCKTKGGTVLNFGVKIGDDPRVVTKEGKGWGAVILEGVFRDTSKSSREAKKAHWERPTPIAFTMASQDSRCPDRKRSLTPIRIFFTSAIFR